MEWRATMGSIEFVPDRGVKVNTKSPAVVKASSGSWEGMRVVIVETSRGA
jgi:tRNA G18 (ribose-2'-O)-methylase SpoU